MTPPPPDERMVRDLSFEEYLRDDGISASFLKTMYAKSPAHAIWEAENRHDVDSPARLLGRATHCRVFEFPKFLERYTVLPEINKRTKAGQAEYAVLAAGGMEVVTTAQAQAVNEMTAALRAHPVASKLLFEGDGDNEASLFWTRDGVRCKARLDRIVMEKYGPRIIDLKTTINARHDAFQREIVRWDRNYHIQGAWYQSGLYQIDHGAAGWCIPVTFIAVESSPPYGVSVNTLDEGLMDVARAACDELFETVRKCRETSVWPNYPPDEATVLCPPWMESEEMISE